MCGPNGMSHKSVRGGEVGHFSPYCPEMALGKEHGKGLQVKGNLKSLEKYVKIFYVGNSALTLQCVMKKLSKAHFKVIDAA